MSVTRAGQARIAWADRLRILLWASLAANLFFAGLVGSHLLHPARMAAPGLDGFIARLVAALPEEDAGRFRAVLDGERPWYDQARAAADRARGRLADAVAETPYDEAATRERMQELRARLAETSDRFGDSLLAALRGLSPDGRQRLAATLRRPPHH